MTASLDDEALRIGVVLSFYPARAAERERAAVRWVERFAREGRGVELASLRKAVEAFEAMPDEDDREQAVADLVQLCRRHELA